MKTSPGALTKSSNGAGASTVATWRTGSERRGNCTLGHGFADPDLEALPAAQKQLLRMGPRNVRIIQSSLREIALALGIPAERLPAPRT